MRSVFRHSYAQAPTNGDLRGRKFMGLWRMIRGFFHARKQGVVLLWK